MKRILNTILTVLFVLLFVGCDNHLLDDSEDSRYPIYTFINNSTYALVVTENLIDFTLETGDSKKIEYDDSVLGIAYDFDNIEYVEATEDNKTITFSDIVFPEYTFINNSNYDLTISDNSSSGDDFIDFTVLAGKTSEPIIITNLNNNLSYSFTNSSFVSSTREDNTITFTDTPWATHEQYLSLDDYNTLLDILEAKTSIDKDVIDAELELLNVRQNYDYSLYAPFSVSHDMHWKLRNSADTAWIYSVKISIWTDENGILKRSKCTYDES